MYNLQSMYNFPRQEFWVISLSWGRNRRPLAGNSLIMKVYGKLGQLKICKSHPFKGYMFNNACVTSWRTMRLFSLRGSFFSCVLVSLLVQYQKQLLGWWLQSDKDFRFRISKWEFPGQANPAGLHVFVGGQKWLSVWVIMQCSGTNLF